MIPALNIVCVVFNVINAAMSLVLGLIILFKNSRSRLHQLWWWMSLAVTVWGTGLAITFLSIDNYPLALFTLRVADTVAIFIPLFYLHFIVVFLQRNDRRRVLITCYALSIALACFSFSPLYIPAIKTKMGIHNFNDAGPLFWLFFALYIWEPLYAMRLVWQARQISTGTRRAHITYVLAAGLVGFIIGGLWFPLCFDVPILPIGGCFVWLYCLFVAWAVFKYQLFDIRVVIRKSLAYSILVTLLTVGYFGLVYSIEQIFKTTMGYKSFWVSLTAFALMALLFQPIKIGVQKIVDWLVFRSTQEHLVKKLERLEEQALQTEKFKAVSTLAAGMAHEIKNPLTTLKTFTEYIPEKQNDPAFLQKLHEVYTTEINRIQSIVKELLEFSKPRLPELKPVDLGPLIASTVNLLSGELLRHRVQWTVDCRHNGAILKADADQLRQVLINLIQNAADAMPAGGQLTIATQAVNSHLELTVSDTGSGISAALLPKIFDPFVTTKPDGNGLGLAVVYSILQAHHGSIRADSEPNRGTTFTVSLPL